MAALFAHSSLTELVTAIAPAARPLDSRDWVDRASLRLALGTVDFARSRWLPEPPARAVRLSPRESRLLAYLADRPNETVERDALLVDVWDLDACSESRAVDTAVARLRRKLEPDPAAPQMLFTEHGEGYRLLVARRDAVAPPAVAPAPAPHREIPLADRVVDLTAGVVRYDDETRTDLRLSANERRLLEELHRVGGAAVARAPLARRSGIASADAVRSTVHRLRRKLEVDPSHPRILCSVHGGGYRLAVAVQSPDVDRASRLVALRSLAAHLGAVLGFFDVVLYLREREALVQAAAWGPKCGTDGDVIEPMRQRLGHGVVGHVARDDAPTRIDDVRHDRRYLPDRAALFTAQSEMAMPVRFEGRVVGVIDAEHPDPAAFRASQLDTLSSMATIAAPAFALLAEEPHRG